MAGRYRYVNEALCRITITLKIYSDMTHNKRLTHLMILSWEIERTKHLSRSKALQAAWAITNHADITIHYLVRRHSHAHNPNKVSPEQVQLFNNQ